MASLSEYDSAVELYRTQTNGFFTRVNSLNSGSSEVEAVLAAIASEMPAATIFTDLDTQIGNLEKNGGFSGEKATADALLAKLRTLNSDVADLATQVTNLEAKK